MSHGLAPSKSTVYVSNLPFDLSNNDIHKLFEKHGRIIKVTVVKDRETRKSKGVAFILFLNRGDAKKCVDDINMKEMFGRTLKASIAIDNGRSAEFIRRKNYPNKSQCYECGEIGHLSYKCSKNLLGERDPPPKKTRKRKKPLENQQHNTDMINYFADSEEDVADAAPAEEEIDDCETLSAAIAMEREKSELEEYRYRVAMGDYTTTESSQQNKKKIKKSSYFSDEEESITMPRRKRNRKNKRKGYKQQRQNQNLENVQRTNKNVAMQETPRHETKDTFYTLPNTVTPLTTPSTPVIRKSVNDKVSNPRNYLVNMTTPTNIHRSSSRTNLSKRFDDIVDDRNNESLNNVTPKHSQKLREGNNSYINNLNHRASAIDLIKNCVNKRSIIRSNSSMSKLRSPGLDRIPVMVDVATQTVYFNNNAERSDSHMDDSDGIYLRSCINIFETPKISQMEKLEHVCKFSTPVSHIFQGEISKVDDTSDLNNLNFQNYEKQFNEIIYSNACASPKIVKNDIKNNESDCDLLIFSPQLRTVSTPIQKFQKNDKTLENMAKNILNAHLDRKLHEKRNDYINLSPKTPNDKKLNREFDDINKINKLYTSMSKRRVYNVSPKKIKDVSARSHSYSKNNSFIREKSLRQDSGIVPKTFSPQRSSRSHSNNLLNVSSSNMYTRFMSNVKKIHSRYSTKWFDIVKDVCSGLGITVKQKLSTFCLATQDIEEIDVDPNKVTIQKSCHNCENYQKRIVMLTTLVNNLDKELHENKERVAGMNEEIEKIKEELVEFHTIKKKVTEIEEKLDTKMSATITPSVGVSPPPPPPPPIPPPLPPPLPTSTAPPFAAKITKNTNSKKVDKKNCENARPVISLNDILNVKLKKTSDKPLLPRRVTQPLISVEMLNQVKLRPASRPQTPSSLKDVSTPSSLSSSPASSLTKLLNTVDPNIRRIKRLRRIGRYSLDESRKYLLRRERNYVEDS